MTTLTPNRIIQQGDEYRNNGTWKAVPKEDYGLQVMFTKYAEVRRPSEAPSNTFPVPVLAEHGKPNPTKTSNSEPSEARESTPDTIPTETRLNVSDSRDGETPSYTPAQIDFAARLAHAVSHLPTIISKKAHQDAIEHPDFVGHVPPEIAHAENIVVTPKGEIEKALEEAKAIGITIKALDLRWPKNGCTWTGRNGTFDAFGMEIRNMGDRISLCPRGKRGLGNGEIQFPKSVIPEIVDWLEDQYKGTPK